MAAATPNMWPAPARKHRACGAEREVKTEARRPSLVPGITNRYCYPSFETATSRPPQDEVQLVETKQPHAEERASRASRSMGNKRLADLSSSVLGKRYRNLLSSAIS